MKIAGSAFADHADLAPGCAAVLSRIAVGDDLEFRDGIHSEGRARNARTGSMIEEI